MAFAVVLGCLVEDDNVSVASALHKHPGVRTFLLPDAEVVGIPLGVADLPDDISEFATQIDPAKIEAAAEDLCRVLPAPLTLEPRLFIVPLTGELDGA